MVCTVDLVWTLLCAAGLWCYLWSWETGWPNPFRPRANLAHIYSDQLLTSSTGSYAGCGPKRAKILKNAKTCHLSNFFIL